MSLHSLKRSSKTVAMAQGLRRTRFVCISDTHNASPEDGAFKLPKGDVLVHAGDLTKQGTFAELKETLDWIENADFEVKVIVAGEVGMERRISQSTDKCNRES